MEISLQVEPWPKPKRTGSKERIRAGELKRALGKHATNQTTTSHTPYAEPVSHCGANRGGSRHGGTVTAKDQDLRTRTSSPLVGMKECLVFFVASALFQPFKWPSLRSASPCDEKRRVPMLQDLQTDFSSLRSSVKPGANGLLNRLTDLTVHIS